MGERKNYTISYAYMDLLVGDGSIPFKGYEMPF